MSLFFEMTHIYDQTKNKIESEIYEVVVGDVLKLFGFKMSTRKLIKLNGTPESHPSAMG